MTPNVGRRFEPSVESAAWFVISESLTNAVKHSRADAVVVRIRTSSRLRVEVSDNGVGIDSGAAGLGLAGMSDRVSALAGTLEIAAGADGGTRLSFTLPLTDAPPTDVALTDDAPMGEALMGEAPPGEATDAYEGGGIIGIPVGRD